MAARTEWRPIASAPKDGRPVLLYENGDVYLARWVCRTHGPPAWDTGFRCADDGPHLIERPTLWAPVTLPEHGDAI